MSAPADGATHADWPHLFRPGAGALVLALHGTGGVESDAVALAERIAPGAAILSPRGRVSENGAGRWFRRASEGVFDVDDVIRRADELAGFVGWAVAEYGLDGHGLNGHGLDGHGLDGHGLDGHGLNGHGLDGHGLNGHGLDGHGLDGHGLDGHGLDGHGLDGHGLNGHPLVATGFSNGANMALALGMLHPRLVPTVVAFSGMYPFGDRTLPRDLGRSRLLLLNGTADPMAPQSSVDVLARTAAEQGAAVTRVSRDGGHGIQPAELNEAERWITGLAAAP